MENFLSENFEVKPKNSSEEALQRWRNLVGIVKNPKRRFRFTADLSKRYEAAAMRRTNQEKLRIAVLVSKCAIQFIQGSIVVSPMEKSMAIRDECEEVEEESLVPLQGLRGGEDLQDATMGSTVSGCSRPTENSSMNLRDEIREESSVIRHSRSNSRGSHDILPIHQARSDQASFNTTPPCDSFFKVLIPCLLVFVAVKCQVKSLDPFVTYPKQTWSFIVAIFAYCLILLALKQSQNRSAEFLQFLCRVGLASGVLSSFSLVSLLLSHIPGQPLLYASWALSTIISAFPILQRTCNWLLTGIKARLNVFISPARNLFTGWNFTQQQPPLPVIELPV